MVEPRYGELFAPVPGFNDHAAVSIRRRFDRADRDQLESGRLDQRAVGFLEPVPGDGERQHIVLAAGQGEGERLRVKGGSDLIDSGGDRYLGAVDPDRHPG